MSFPPIPPENPPPSVYWCIMKQYVSMQIIVEATPLLVQGQLIWHPLHLKLYASVVYHSL